MNTRSPPKSLILRVSCKIIIIKLHLLCKRPDVFMIPWTLQKWIYCYWIHLLIECHIIVSGHNDLIELLKKSLLCREKSTVLLSFGSLCLCFLIKCWFIPLKKERKVGRWIEANKCSTYANSPRARYRVNRVVEVKRFEREFLCWKVCLIKKSNS